MTPELIGGGGYDIQGFYWDPLLVTREEYRNERNQSMRNYQKTVEAASQNCLSLKHVC